MSKSATSTVTVGVEVKLSSLQDRCKRDPEGYRDDYEAQVRRLQSEVDILRLSPSAYNPSHTNLVELIQFAAAVASSSYKGTESDRIASLLMNLLTGTDLALQAAQKDSSNRLPAPSAAFLTNISSSVSYITKLHKDVRQACVSALILMRNKGAIPPVTLLELFFQLLSTVPDKNIRESCYKHLVNDIRNLNKKAQNERINRTVQSFLHKVIVTSSAQHSHSADTESSSDLAARKCVEMVCELYRRQVWTDARTIAILASAVESPITGVLVRAMRFFLNIEEKMAHDREHGIEDDWNSVKTIQLHKHSGKTKKRERHVKNQMKARAKEQKKRDAHLAGEDVTNGMHDDVVKSKKLYPAIELLNDPQGLAETVFKRLKSASTQYKFEVKMLMMNFVTRLVGNHELILLPLYPFLQKYMGGAQRDVTSVLAYSVQACHELVPPDEVYGMLKTIAHNFITERCSGEQMAVGINAARAICTRCPSVMNKDESEGKFDEINSNRTTMDIEGFAQDLAAYSKHRDSSVRVAGKSWMNFVREVHPSLLAGKDRGSHGAALHRSGEKPLKYGETRVAMGVQGADLLAEYEMKKALLQSRKSTSKQLDDVDDGSEDWVDVDGGDDAIAASGDDEDEQWEEVEGEEEEEEGDDENDEAASKEGEGEEEEGDDDSEEAASNEDEEEEAEDGSEAPELVNVDETEQPKAIDLSKMTKEERAKFQQNVSATRIFTASDFEKMRKLVARAEKEKRDPRAAARRKRAEAAGQLLDELSDESEDESEDEGPRVAGMVQPDDIMADAKRKRQSKAEKLEKIVAGREKFTHKDRAGSSTNTEKSRKKNFLMQKFSRTMRAKKDLKATAIHSSKRKASKLKGMTHEAKKRRRKL